MKQANSTHVAIHETYVKMSPLDEILTIWARWSALSDQKESTGTADPADTREFMIIGESADIMINALPRHMWWAVYKSKGICTCWMFKDMIFMDSLKQAEEILEKKMRLNVAMRKFFL